MALSDEVIARYSTQRLARLTNPDATEATTADATRLARACTDAEAEFQRRTATVFDVTEAHHVDVCVELVILKLLERGSGSIEGTREQRERTERQFESLAKVTGRDRPTPVSTGQYLTPSEEIPSGSTVRPKFDPAYLSGYTAPRPGS